ncbi:MAG TPA: hypothetical protein VGU01_15180 [Sphingomicrobium sp.]|nr:hypothetical protein [Sphingomicrobium sp.]
MRIRMFAITIASTMSVSSPALAYQTDNPYGGGTRFTGPPPAEIPTGVMTQEDRARLLTQRLAACLIKAHRAAVLKAIQIEPWQSDARRFLANAVDAKCLDSGELEIPPNLLRGAFYQQFYRERFATTPPALPPVPIDFTASSAGGLTDDAKTEVALRQFGDCVARRDLKDAHALIFSSPGSARETAALTALMPQFSACLVQGSKWTLNRSSISAILSEVVFREATDASRRTPK